MLQKRKKIKLLEEQKYSFSDWDKSQDQPNEEKKKVRLLVRKIQFCIYSRKKRDCTLTSLYNHQMSLCVCLHVQPSPSSSAKRALVNLLKTLRFFARGFSCRERGTVSQFSELVNSVNGDASEPSERGLTYKLTNRRIALQEMEHCNVKKIYTL